MSRREKREYSDTFIANILQLRKEGRTRVDLLREYDLNPSTYDRWVRDEKNGLASTANAALWQAAHCAVKQANQHA